MYKLISILYMLFLLITNREIIDYNKLFEEAKNQIDLPSEVDDDIIFPSYVNIDGKKVFVEVYTNSKNLTKEGKVLRTNDDVFVDVYAKLSYLNKSRYTKLQTIKVLKIDIQKYEILLDMDELFPNYLVEFSLDNGNREDFTWISSNEDVLEIDEEFIGICKKPGTSTVQIIDNDGNVCGEKEIKVGYYTPTLRINEKVIVDKDFKINCSEYDDYNDFIITYDEGFVTYQEGVFHAIKPGKTTITFTLKADEKVTSQIEVNIYNIYPEIKTNGTDVTIGESLKITVLNYNVNEYEVTIDNNDIAYLEDNKVIPKKQGIVIVKVSLISNKDIYSSVKINCLPVVPELLLSNPVIFLEQSTKVFITNLDKLISDDMSEYEITSQANDIAIVSNGIIIGKQVGNTLINVTNINNPYVSSSVLVEVQEKWNSQNEVNEGKLVVYLEKDRFTYQIGEKIPINVDGMKDVNNFKFITHDQSIISPLEDGYAIPKKEGIVTLFVIRKDNVSVKGSVTLEIKGKLKVNYADRLVEVAETQLGYREDSSGETKYGKWYGIPDGAWCAMFVTWCAHNSGIDTDIIPFYCGCTAGWNWFVEKGRAGLKEEYIPKRGDIIFFLLDGASHTGIVTDCDGKTVYTIEGNTSNMCAKRSYPIDWHTIKGYGIPNYELMENMGNEAS